MISTLPVLCSNRTFMELKLIKKDIFLIIFIRSNRTFMELKSNLNSCMLM